MGCGNQSTRKTQYFDATTGQTQGVDHSSRVHPRGHAAGGVAPLDSGSGTAGWKAIRQRQHGCVCKQLNTRNRFRRSPETSEEPRPYWPSAASSSPIVRSTSNSSLRRSARSPRWPGATVMSGCSTPRPRSRFIREREARAPRRSACVRIFGGAAGSPLPLDASLQVCGPA